MDADCNFVKLREELNDYGYYQNLSFESVPLVKKLLGDLKTTTESLQKYMTIAHNAIQEKENLELGAEPYKTDNARLVKECNELHLAFLNFREQTEKIQKDLKTNIFELEELNQELLAQNTTLKRRITDFELLELDEADRNLHTKGLKKTIQSKVGKNLLLSSSVNTLNSNKNHLTKSNMNSYDMSEQDFRKARNHHHQINDKLLQQRSSTKFSILQDEINCLTRDKLCLEKRYKEALTKQHEAMKRALHLAERNKQLEKELKDIDQMALQVEAQCNTSVQGSALKITKLQGKLEETFLQMQGLEKSNKQLKQEKNEYIAEIDTLKAEKKRLKQLLDNSLEEKKELTNKINNFTMMEEDLNKEIDRLSQTTANQRKKITELECFLLAERADKSCLRPRTAESDALKIGNFDPTYKSAPALSSNPYAQKHAVFMAKAAKDDVLGILNEAGEMKNCPADCARFFKELLDKELTYRHTQGRECLDSITKEKNYYMQQYHKLLNDQKVNPVCKRLQRERDILKCDVQRLEQECECLKQRIKTITDCHCMEKEKFKMMMSNSEKEIKKLEQEKRENDRTSIRISELDEQSDQIRNKLAKNQMELDEQKSLNEKLKKLLEETEKALSDLKKRLVQTEDDLANALSQKNRGRNENEEEISNLKDDLATMRQQLNKLDKDRDDLVNKLDDKTEKLVNAESELGNKTRTINILTEKLNDMSKKMGDAMNLESQLDSTRKNCQIEITSLREEVEKLLRDKDGLLKQNRYLEDDLAKCLADKKRLEREFDLLSNQINDLTRQVQMYVAEIKKMEDHISQKEVERQSLLEQFRNLNIEYSNAGNAQTQYESEANNTKYQLSVALENAQDLEQQLNEKMGLIQNYEKMLGDATNQIARLEIQVKQDEKLKAMLEDDTNSLRDLVSKIDKEKDDLRRQLLDNAGVKQFSETTVGKLKQDKEALSSDLAKEQQRMRSTENLLKDTRQELVDQKILNEELRRETELSKRKIQDLEEKFQNLSDQLDMYQEKALEYSQENKKLRREIIDDKFNRERGDGDHSL